MARTEINADEWREALREAEGDRADKVPAGFLAANQLASQLGVKRRRAEEIATSLASAGRAVRKKFRIQTGAGIRAVTHFKLGKITRLP